MSKKTEEVNSCNIKLDEEWYLRSDCFQWILAKPQAKGKYKNVYYFGNIENAIKEYIQIAQRTSKAKSMEDLIKTTKCLGDKLNQALAPLKVTVMVNQNE